MERDDVGQCVDQYVGKGERSCAFVCVLCVRLCVRKNISFFLGEIERNDVGRYVGENKRSRNIFLVCR